MTEELIIETDTHDTAIQQVILDNEPFFKISHVDAMRPFFMSIVSFSNHWMFISSNGGLTAGRKNSEYALFPYYTDDKITETADITGSKSIFQIEKDGKIHIWEPFSERYEGRYKTTRNLYKNKYGNKVVFEEINHDLELTFRYQWNSSNALGFIKKSKLINHGDSRTRVQVLDGIQNILPQGINSELQNAYSNLVDAYKRNELDPMSGMGIYALSAVIVDRAEPSEALKANIAWSVGLENPTHLVSSLQLKNFRKGREVHQETDVKAEKGAYFISAALDLASGEEKEWMIIADVNKNHADIEQIAHKIKNSNDLSTLINKHIDQATDRLIDLNASSDALQCTSDKLRDTRHFSNTLFNIMRGGIFDHNYQIERWDFKKYLTHADKQLAKDLHDSIDALPETFTLQELKTLTAEAKNNDFKRLALEYLPLKFSRRHGDPSRPWNKFSINTQSEIDGSKILDYEGNWRDIFQNWEALVLSYPAFIESMIHKFLNATTFDGYNPYRVTKGGFDWEIIEENDPWSYIGYWGDHQIIYLLKFLECIDKHQPHQLESLFNEDIFVYANVPYKIKSYQDLLLNSKNTIDFDVHLDEAIRNRRDKVGADGALLQNKDGKIVKASFIEKILVTTLAKMSNFIPEGGIWMNTQRPEWNDANNALVGNGVSMVTLYYLRRFFVHLGDMIGKSATNEFTVSAELNTFFTGVVHTLESHRPLLDGTIDDVQRKMVLDGLGEAGSSYRLQIYQNAFTGNKQTITKGELQNYIELCLDFLQHSIRSNRREDGLFHAYNLMTVDDNDRISIDYLDEMLEGQVAVLSTKYLSSQQALEVLDAMKTSKLFRDDQYSYILYPFKELKGFKDRNTIPSEAIEKSRLLTQLIADGNKQIIEQDINGTYHFNGNFKNAIDLKQGLDRLSSTYVALRIEGDQEVMDIYEEVFNHKAFTGRSGTFYGYEGLGSIYWHMVSKLLVAVQESCLEAIEQSESPEIIGRLLEHYYEINAGIGVHKPPSLHGAFPTDPYSHTPAGKGAQQPGMTGQVKEDILCRFGEFGVFVSEGKLYFDPCLLRKSEFLQEPRTFTYVTIDQERKELQLEKNSLCFTYCQVPIVYHISDSDCIVLHLHKDEDRTIEGISMDAEMSQELFNRTGTIEQIHVHIKLSHLK